MSREHKPDAFYFRAKREGFVARAVFKLKEIDGKYRLFRPGGRVVDLGAAPGSWLQYLAERVGEKGRAVGVDLRPFRLAPHPAIRLVENDVFRFDPVALLREEGPFDAVVSDLAPATTGARDGDHVRSIELCERALAVAAAVLKPGGAFVCKMFQGGDSPAFLRAVRKRFESVKTQKPEASRGESREVYVVALGFRATSGEG